MATQEQPQHHHHHHKHKKDGSTRFVEKSLREIRLRRTFERVLKIALIIIAAILCLAVIVVYKIE